MEFSKARLLHMTATAKPRKVLQNPNRLQKPRWQGPVQLLSNESLNTSEVYPGACCFAIGRSGGATEPTFVLGRLKLSRDPLFGLIVEAPSALISMAVSSRFVDVAIPSGIAKAGDGVPTPFGLMFTPSNPADDVS